MSISTYLYYGKIMTTGRGAVLFFVFARIIMKFLILGQAPGLVRGLNFQGFLVLYYHDAQQN